MLTVNDVRFKILDICNEYHTENPSIHVPSLIFDLNSTKEELIPHLETLHSEGVITFSDPINDTFSLI